MELIRTRMTPPSRSAGLAARPRLAGRCDALHQFRLTLIKAPAGYGKSSLMQAWHHRLTAGGQICGWLSMDGAINDAGLFFRYIAACVQAGAPGLAARLAAFLADAHDPLPSHMAAAFVNAVADDPRDLFLFIDDLHLTRCPDIHAALALILRDAPAHLHLVVASRETPGFSLARLRMLGVLQELDAGELRFNAEELDALTRSLGREAFTPQDARSLLAMTEGWPAGLQLAILAMPQHGDVERFVSQFSGENRTISDFMIEDVLSGLPVRLVDFLLRSAVLTSFNAALCDAVLGITDAREQIRQLADRGLFIFSLDDKGDWFRYHHLFSGALLRLLRVRAGEAVPELHRRASRWYGEHGQTEMAFSHAVDAGDWSAAGQILDTNCMNLFYQGRLRTLDNLARRLPLEVLHQLPRVQLEQAWALILEWNFTEAQRTLQRVEDLLAQWQRQGRGEAVLGEVKRLLLHRRMMLALFTDDVIALERLVLELLHDFPLEDPYLRGTLENCLMYARRETYRLENVTRMDRTARDFFAKSGSTFVLVWHEAILAPTLHLQGKTDEALQALRGAMDIAGYVAGEQTPLQAMPALLIAEILYETGDMAAAQALMTAHGPQGDSLGFVDNLAALYVTGAALQRHGGDFAAARETLARGEACAQHRGFTRLSVRIWHEQIRLAGAAGDVVLLNKAWELAEGPAIRARLTPQGASASGDEYLALGVAQLACQLGHARVAVDLMRTWAHFTAGRGAIRSEVRCLVMLACALNLLGESGEARRKMRQALQKAHAPRLVMSFLDAGPQAHAILRDLFSAGEEATGPVSAFGIGILQMLGDSGREREGAHGPSASDGAAPPEALSLREHDILRLAALGKSNKDIARVMGLTEGTVKWYMQQIFAKMDVRRRSAAVQRARALGWL